MKSQELNSGMVVPATCHAEQREASQLGRSGGDSRTVEPRFLAEPALSLPKSSERQPILPAACRTQLRIHLILSTSPRQSAAGSAPAAHRPRLHATAASIGQLPVSATLKRSRAARPQVHRHPRSGFPPGPGHSGWSIRNSLLACSPPWSGMVACPHVRRFSFNCSPRKL